MLSSRDDVNTKYRSNQRFMLDLHQEDEGVSVAYQGGQVRTETEFLYALMEINR